MHAVETLPIEQIELIIFIGAIVALIARRLEIPYTVGLISTGIFGAPLPLDLKINFSKELLFRILPPLVFESALYSLAGTIKTN